MGLPEWLDAAALTGDDRRMRLLVLGGGWFLGRTVVEEALTRGWEVTTFSRGRTGRDVAGVEAVRGDRTVPGDLARLAAAGPWQAVVDTSGQEPWVVNLAASTLAGSADRYVFVSTVNAYQGWPVEPLDDESPLRPSRPDLRVADVEDLPRTDRYGTLKAGCELAVNRHFGDRVLVLRPGVILGRYEYVGRLPWLLARMRRGGEVLAGGPPTRSIQPIDVRDVAVLALNAVRGGWNGSMNLTAPIEHATYGQLLDTCREVTGAHAELVWVDPDWLAAQDVDQWREIPLWRATGGAWSVRSDRACSAGLSCRPLAETVTDTWQWLQREQPVAHSRASKIGLDPGKEAALLAAWNAVRSTGPGW